MDDEEIPQVDQTIRPASQIFGTYTPGEFDAEAPVEKKPEVDPNAPGMSPGTQQLSLVEKAAQLWYFGTDLDIASAQQQVRYTKGPEVTFEKPGYMPTADDILRVSDELGLPESVFGKLAEARSPDDLTARANAYATRMYRDIRLSETSTGFGGFVEQTAISMLDPSVIMAAGGLDKLTAPIKVGSRFGQVVKTLGVDAAVMLPLEAAKVEKDPFYSAEQAAFTVFGSLLLSGGISALTSRRGGAEASDVKRLDEALATEGSRRYAASVGAAQAGPVLRERPPIDVDPTAPEKAGFGAFGTPVARLARSENPEVRALNEALTWNPGGQRAQDVTILEAQRRITEAGSIYHREARMAARDWARANGRTGNWLSNPMAQADDDTINDFMTLVAQVHAGVRESTDPHVMRAVKAFQDGYEDSLRYVQNSSYNGPGSESLPGISMDEFADIEHDPRYVMRRFSAPGWRRTLNTLGKDRVVDRLARTIWRSNSEQFIERASRGLSGSPAVPSAAVDSKFTFGGRKATNFDPAKLQTAERMLAEGQSPRAIWSETGLYRAKDKKWRNEITDEGARWKRSPLRLPRTSETGTHFTPLGELLDHPALFEAYPSLADVRVMITSRLLDKGTLGGYDKGSKVAAPIVLLRPGKPAEMLTVLLHELQHGVQAIEGFADGLGSTAVSNPAYRQYSKFVDEADGLLWLREDYGPQIQRAEKLMLEMQEAGASADAARVALQQRYPQWAAYRQQLDDLKARGFDESWIDKPPEQFIDSHERYLRLHGEAEARNVEARQLMGNDERRAAFPEDTLDVPASELIVRSRDPRDRMQLSRPRSPSRSTLIDQARQDFGPDVELLFDDVGIKLVDEPPGHWPDDAIAEATGTSVTMAATRVDPANLKGFILHEIGIHTDLGRVLGDEGKAGLLGHVDNLVSEAKNAQALGQATPEQLRVLDARELAIKNAAKAEHIREETLAYLVQEAPDLPLIRQLMADLRAWLYTTFPALRASLDLSEGDLQSLAKGVVNRRIREARESGSAFIGQSGNPQRAFARAGEVSAPPPAGKPIDDLDQAAYDIATRVARKYADTVERLLNPASKRVDLHAPVTPESRQAAKELVRDLFNDGIDFADNAEDAIEMVLDLVAPIRNASIESARAKSRLKLDLRADADGEILGMFDWNAEALFATYRRHMAGRAGFLKAGFSRVQDFDARVQAIRDSVAQAPEETQVRTRKEADLLDTMKHAALGQPPAWLQEGNEDWIWMTNQFRRYNYTRLMNNVGFLSFSEVMGAATKLGPFRLLASIPAYGKYIRQIRAGDPKAIESIYYTADALMGHGSAQVRSRLIGFQNRFDDNFADAVDRNSSGLRKGIDTFTRKSANATSRLSGMAPLGEWLRSAVAGADAQDWVTAARAGKMPYSKRRMMTLGVDADAWVRISGELRRMSDIRSPDTGQARPFIDFNSWADGEAANIFLNAIDRNSRRLVMEGDVGHKSFLLDRPSMRMLFQFLNFPINAWSKHLKFAANVHDPRALAEASAMALGGGIGHIARVTAIAYAAKTVGEERDRYLEENLNSAEIAKGMVYYSAHGSVLPNLVDLGFSVANWAGVEGADGKALTPLFSKSRASGLAGDPLVGNASRTSLEKMGRTALSWMDGELSEQDLESLVKAWAPLGNHIAMMAAVNAIAELLPDEEEAD